MQEDEAKRERERGRYRRAQEKQQIRTASKVTAQQTADELWCEEGVQKGPRESGLLAGDEKGTLPEKKD